MKSYNQILCKHIIVTMDGKIDSKSDLVFAAGFILFRKILPDTKVEFLLIQSSSGKWGVPKGHIEDGESAYEAALRETKEESGLEEGKDFKVIPDFKSNVSYEVNNPRNGNKLKAITFWLGEITNKDCVVKLLPEHQGYKWVEIKEVVVCMKERPGRNSWISCHEECNRKVTMSSKVHLYQ